MKRFRITGDYGSFVVTRVIEADTEADAWMQTGIMIDLRHAGWTVVSSPDGEEWTIEEVPSAIHQETKP